MYIRYKYVFYFFIPFIFYSFFRISLFNSFSSCIVVRINDVTKDQLSRYISWRKSFPRNYKFYLLSMKELNNFSKSIYKIESVVVTFNEIIEYYPDVLKLRGNCSTFKTSRLISWISHSESIVLFYRKIKYKYRYIWIIEQDVGYTGDLYKFVKMYEKVNVDLITINVRGLTLNWVWLYCATENYLKRRKKYFKDTFGYGNREYVQRWSRKYISKMFLDLSKKLHSQSETSSIETVFYHNLTYLQIPQNNIGSPLCAGKSITKQKWINISHSAEYQNKFFHPLKF